MGNIGTHNPNCRHSRIEQHKGANAQGAGANG
jgi:hypothetical protein